jgi:uncharacterized protein YbbC (DUF1343 family)
LFEGTNFSEGRGTDRPFEYIGAPYCDADVLISELEQYSLPGVKFEKINFMPTSIASPSNPPKYVGEQCEGIFINVKDEKTFQPVVTSIAVIISLKKLFPEFKWRQDNFINKLAGTKLFKNLVDEGASLSDIENSYQKNLGIFKNLRNKYIVYK